MFKKSLYARTAFTALFSKAAFSIMGLAILWLLTAVLGKSDFGLFMLAQTILTIIASMVTSGFQYVVMYNVSRLGGENDQIRIRDYGGTTAALGGLVGLVLAAILFLASDYISGLFSKPDLAVWLTGLSLILPLNIGKDILVFWFRAQQKTSYSILMQETVPNGLIMVLLFAVYLISNDIYLVLYAYWGAAVISFLLLAFKEKLSFVHPLKLYSLWDLQYGGKIFVTKITGQPLRSIDLLLVGAMASEQVLSEYALASRLAIFLIMGKQLAVPLLVPRMGAHIADKQYDQVEREFSASQYFGSAVCLFGIVVISALGPYLLPLFGTYEAAFPLLLLMAATMFARTLAGNAPEYLNMAGYAGYGMAAVVISCLAYAFPGLYLIWQFGAQGATYALFISNCLLFGLCLCFIYYKDDVRLLGIYSLFFLLSVCLIIGLITFGFLSPLLGSVLLLALLVLFIVQKGAFRNLVAILKIR